MRKFLNQMKILQVCYNLVEESVYPYCFWLSKCTQNCQKPKTHKYGFENEAPVFLITKKRVYYCKCCIINVK